MKRLIIFVSLALLIHDINAQNAFTIPANAYIESYRLEVTLNKTTNIVFPYAITTVDRGSQDIIVKKATGLENILRVKADIKNFNETNLTVITSNGKLYSFVVNYTNEPAYLALDLSDTVSKQNDVGAGTTQKFIYSSRSYDKAAIRDLVRRIDTLPTDRYSIHQSSGRVIASCNGIYAKDNLLFFRLHIRNHSTINYDVDQFHFYIRDRKQPKRMPSQELEINPLYVSGDTSSIRQNGEVTWVVALPKFTLAHKKQAIIEIMEEGGGRQFQLILKNRHILKTKSL